MKAADTENVERNLFLVVRAAISFSLAVMVAFLYSIKAVHPALRYAFTFGTLAAFVITGLAAWFVLHFLFKRAGQPANSPHDRRLLWFAVGGISLILIAGMVLAFGRAMENLPSVR